MAVAINRLVAAYVATQLLHYYKLITCGVPNAYSCN